MWWKNILLYIFRRKRRLLPPPASQELLEEINQERAIEEEPGYHYLSDDVLPFSIAEDREENLEDENEESNVLGELNPEEDRENEYTFYETTENSHFKNNDMENEEQRGYFQNWMPHEFKYLEALIGFRLGRNKRPRFPDLDDWDLPMAGYLREMELEDDEKICTLLLIALAPHAFPDLFDRSIEGKIKTSGDFPEIGGARGKNFRGFLPTGQTAVFLLAGDDWDMQAEVEQLLWSNHLLTRKSILWLEEMQAGEPLMSGKIIMGLDYINRFLFQTAAPPQFSTSFPARRIHTRLGVDDIVMNRDVKRHFKNLEDWIRHNPSLMEDWGMDRSLRQGFRVLFYGPSGTGKTLTATILGNQTGKEVYKIDLSMMISKFVGDTEKNLAHIFALAEDKNWILFFDEADAIFGKRTSVRDAHDKYANQEVSYLLQRIEDFNGLVILATNMRNNIDEAFIRRFNDIVKFTIPSEEERKEIWEKSFPSESEFDGIPDKVKKYDITGGNIINVIHFAGIQAVKKRNEAVEEKLELVEDECSCRERHEEPEEDGRLKFYIEDVIEGIRREMIKEGKPFIL